MIRHVIDRYGQTIPAILEIPSKEHPYDASKDSILRRAKVHNCFSLLHLGSSHEVPNCSVWPVCVCMFIMKTTQLSGFVINTQTGQTLQSGSLCLAANSIVSFIRRFVL